MFIDLYKFAPMEYLIQCAGETTSWGEILNEAKLRLRPVELESVERINDEEAAARAAIYHLTVSQLQEVADSLEIGF